MYAQLSGSIRSFPVDYRGISLSQARGTPLGAVGIGGNDAANGHVQEHPRRLLHSPARIAKNAGRGELEGEIVLRPLHDQVGISRNDRVSLGMCEDATDPHL